MRSKQSFFALCRVFFLFAAVCALVSGPVAAEDAPKLEIVAQIQERPANIAVDLQGRIFVTIHPFDSSSVKMMAIDPKDGSAKLFPSEKWNGPTDENEVGIVGAIGTRATLSGTLTVLDMGDAKHSPRILEFNQFSQQVSGVTYIPQNVLTDQSFLQDYAVDWDKGYYFIADMGQKDLLKPAKPAIIIANQRSNWVRRVLEDFPGLQSPSSPLRAEGKDVQIKGPKGKPLSFGAALNPITIDPQREWLYFGPMGAGKLYRIPLPKIADAAVTKEDMLAAIEVVGDKPDCDGITVDAAENVYVANVRDGEIGVMGPGRPYRTYLKDPRLIWPDGFAFGPDGYLYVTISQLNRSAFFNLGTDKSEKPYLIARFNPIAEGTVGR